VLIRHSLLYLLARGLPGLVNFAALLVYTRLLSPDEYGRYALVIAGVAMGNIFVLQWQRLVLARWLPICKEDSRRFLGEMLHIFVTLALVSGAIGMALALVWPDPVWRRLLALAVLLFVAQGWLEFNLTLASAQLAPGRYGRILGSKTLLALAIGSGLAWLGLGTYAPLLGLLAGSVLAILLFGLGMWRGVKPSRPEKGRLREQLRYGLPLIVTFGLSWIIASSDRVLIGWLLDVEAAGQYAVGYDLAQHSLGLLLAIVQVAAYPLVVRALEDHGATAAAGQLCRTGELIMGIALTGGAGIAVLAPQIAAVVVGPEFRVTTVDLLPWIALAAAISGIKAYHFDMAFHLGRNSHGLVVSNATAAIVNIGLNLVLIPRFGIQGAAYATVIAYLLGLLVSAWLGRRVFRMPSALPLLLRAGSVALVVAVGVAASRKLGDGVEGLILGVLSGVAVAVAVALMLDLAHMRTGFRHWWRTQRSS